MYVLTFPTGFFLSCFYPESLFLATTTLACLLGTRGRWLNASLMGGLAVLSRPYGFVVLLPLVWLYLSAHGWRVARLRADALYLLLIPATLLVFLLAMRPLTGHLFGPFLAQAGWHRHLAPPWKTLTSSLYFTGTVTYVQRVLAVSVVGLSLWALKRLPSPAYGLYALAITLPSLMSGTLMGFGRHAAVVFPVYIVLAMSLRRERGHHFLQAMGLAVQVVLMTAWVRFYPVV